MKYLALAVLLLFTFAGMAQQSSTYGFYRDVASYYNPATAGLDHSFKANLLYRNQWTGYPGAPINYMGLVEAKLQKHNSGVGLNIEHQSIGVASQTGVTGNYNYQWSLKDDSNTLTIGVAPKLYSLHFSSLYEEDSSGVLIESRPEARSNAFTMNLGTAFRTNKLFVAIAAMNLIPTEQQMSELNFGHSINFSVMASYDLQLTKNMKLIPNAHIQSDLVSMNFYVNARIEHEKLWYQVGYRNFQVLNASMGYCFMNRVNVGYMLHYSANALIFPYLWSHEAFIAYELR